MWSNFPTTLPPASRARLSFTHSINASNIWRRLASKTHTSPLLSLSVAARPLHLSIASEAVPSCRYGSRLYPAFYGSSHSAAASDLASVYLGSHQPCSGATAITLHADGYLRLLPASNGDFVVALHLLYKLYLWYCYRLSCHGA